MYLETRDIDETMKIYNTAWEKGVKTTYYLHMKPRHTAEQSTTDVNKAQKIGKVGFGSLNFATSPAFSAPLQKSLEIKEPTSTPIANPVPAPIMSKEVAGSIPFDDEILVSTSTAKSTIVPETIVVSVPEKVAIKEEVFIVQASRNEYKPLQNIEVDRQVVGPEDPAEDENNVCISCQ